MKHFILKMIAIITAAVLIISSVLPLFKEEKNVNTNYFDKVNPETWTAVDGLGRKLPSYEEVGEKDNEKFVGMFYWIWHYPFAKSYPARNVTEILKKNPEAVNDYYNSIWDSESDGIPHYWNEPLFGYYTNLDEYVVRKHAEMIADAGVDVIIFDCTNGTNIWEDGYETLFKVFEEARDEGVNVPQIAFILPFDEGSNTKTSLENLYNNIYSKDRYKDLWFMWDGKPLIMARQKSLDSSELDKTIGEFFTFRKNEAEYFCKDTRKKSDTWGWCSVYPQTKFGKSLTGIEEMCVSVAQNASEDSLVAMNDPKVNVRGRSYTKGNYSYSYKKDGKTVTVDKNTENSMLYGLNFQQQWDYAIKCDPDFVFVTGWNEWIAGRFKEWKGTENAFPDEFSDEYSRDIEPCAGVLKDHYYYQLVANIRRFKGVEKSQISSASKTIDIFGDISQWNDVKNEYFHYTGSTKARDCDGWVGIHYTNNTMRNDFRSVKVTYDEDNIYFRIETVDNISPFSSEAWMRILIDSSDDGSKLNWEGFEYVINRDNANEKTLEVEVSRGGWNFLKTGTARYNVTGNIMQVEVPREALGMTDAVKFNFKLSDNMQSDGDITDFYKNGDVAPGGRFAFMFG